MPAKLLRALARRSPRAQVSPSELSGRGNAITRALARAGTAITSFLSPFCSSQKRAFELVEGEPDAAAPTSVSSRPTKRIYAPASRAEPQSEAPSTPASSPTFGRKFHVSASSSRSRLPRKPRRARTRSISPACSTPSSSPSSSSASSSSTPSTENSTPPSSPELVRDALKPLALSGNTDVKPSASIVGIDVDILLRHLGELEMENGKLRSQLAQQKRAEWAVLAVKHLEEELGDIRERHAQELAGLKENYEREHKVQLSAHNDLKAKLEAAESANEKLIRESEGTKDLQARLESDVRYYQLRAKQTSTAGVNDFEQLREHANREREALLMQNTELQAQKDQLVALLQDPQALVALQTHGVLVAPDSRSEAEQPAEPVEMEWESEESAPSVPAPPSIQPVGPLATPSLPASATALQTGPGLTGVPAVSIPAPPSMAPSAFHKTAAPGGLVFGGASNSGALTGGSAPTPQPPPTRDFCNLPERSPLNQRLAARRKAHGRG